MLDIDIDIDIDISLFKVGTYKHEKTLARRLLIPTSYVTGKYKRIV